MGQLAKERTLIRKAPFSAVAVDFVGSIKIKNEETIEKGNILLVTCLTIRVCHLEVTRGQSSEQFMRAWKKFVLRQGVHPRYILSDCAATFKEVKDKVEQLASQHFVRDEDEKDFVWELAVPRAPHRRGCVESLVKLVKSNLTVILKDEEEKSID